MARESQGLQILLIVFVMLAVVLGVTTYLYVKRADEATKAAAVAASSEKTAKDETAKKQSECDDLKRLIGFPERSTEEIKKQFADDMATYGNAKKSDAEPAAGDKPLFDSSTLYYSRLLAGMYKTLQDRTGELITSRALVADLQSRFKNREAEKDAAIAALSAGYGKLESEAKKIAGDYTSGQERNLAETQDLVKNLEKVKKDASDKQIAAAALAKSAREEVSKKESEVKALIIQRNQIDRPEMDVPSGEITWVSLPNKMVWINRGRADGLQRQTKFTVYSADSTIAAKAVKKGTVEVTRIEGDHMAQARILDDKIADPIMAGDNVFTPLWSPGQQNHFALTGIMNLDGDGRNQLSAVRGMINETGGKIDCELDEQGHKQGAITANTRYIVIGDAPDKSSAEFKQNHNAILHDADRYQVHKLLLNDFKQQMSYQKSSSVEHFENGATTGDVNNRAASALKTSKAAPKAVTTAPKSEDSGN
ncbi:MAG: hypothetical protein ABSG53_19035 [Thermoguttaceae bacterium]